MYNSKPSIVYGFHATDESIAKEIINAKKDFIHSENDYDWLGKGIYFWENNLKRAIDYGKILHNRNPRKIKNPFVIGTVLELGNCFDLLDQRNLDFLKVAQQDLMSILENEKATIPKNEGSYKGDFDFKKRYLDCAVIRWAHILSEKYGNQFDSVRAVFWEGEDLYSGAGFKEQNHIQIAIINPNCIKGVFIPRELNSDWSRPS